MEWMEESMERGADILCQLSRPSDFWPEEIPLVPSTES